MAKKPQRYTILIICEGEKTEPNYFGSIRDEIIKNIPNPKERPSITIIPEPSEEESIEEIGNIKTAKKRKLKGQDDNVIYGSPPLKYIEKGKEELLTGAWDEVWAVFDHDDHPKRKEAFDAADDVIKGKKVQIAFSSRSFEHWLLCHFEKNYTAYTVTECKDSNDKPKGCDKNNGCQANICLVGNIRLQSGFENYQKKSIVYPLLKDKIEYAFENAAWLRYKSHFNQAGVSIYNKNPYTNVDKLIIRLLRWYMNFKCINWIGLNQQISYKGLSLIIEKDNVYKFTFTNNTDRALIINKFDILVRFSGDKITIGSKLLLYPDDTKIINIPLNTLPAGSDTLIFIKDNLQIMIEL